MATGFVRLFGKWCLIAVMALPLAAQESSQPDSKDDSAAYVKIARANAARFQIQDRVTGAAIERIDNPVFRYTEPVRGPTQGTVWLWGRTGRPAAVLEMIREGSRDWFCFHATSDQPIQLTAATGQTWTPESSNLQFLPLPHAPPPADAPVGRLLQMKEFMRRFSAHHLWLNTRNEMRVLPAPLHRYEDRKQHIRDGALFAIAVGTHPEATLFLEAVHPANDAKPYWQFAIGRSGAAEMVVLYEDREVYRLPLLTDKMPPPTSSYWRLVLPAADKVGE